MSFAFGMRHKAGKSRVARSIEWGRYLSTRAAERALATLLAPAYGRSLIPLVPLHMTHRRSTTALSHGPVSPRWRLLPLALAATLIGLILGGCRGCGDDAPPVEAASVEQEESAIGLGSGSAEAAEPEQVADPGDAPVAHVNGAAVMSAAELQAALDDMVERYERIDGRPATTSEWRDERRRRLVQDAVHDALVREHVDGQTVTIEDDAVEEAVRAELRHVFEQESLFERFLDSRGMTRDEYMEHKRYELAVDQVLGGRETIEPSEEDILRFYEDNRENWREDDRVLISTITLRLRANASDEQIEAARTRLEGLRERIVREGEPFAEVARQHSEASERFQGGELGWIVRGRRAQFATNGVEDQLFELDLGTITEPVRTQLGWQIFWIRDRREAGVRDFDEVRDVLADPLRRRNRQRARQELVNELIQRADVSYHREAWGLEARSSDEPGQGEPGQ